MAALSVRLRRALLLLLRDAIPFFVIITAWEALHLVPDAMRGTVQSDSVVALERALFGEVPAVTLQAALRRPGELSALDIGLAFAYLGHFVVSAVAAFALWLNDRGLYFRFALALTLVSLAAFVTAIFVPVAPPRFAGSYGDALVVTDVAAEVYRRLDIGWLSWAYVNLIGDPVAAFPSLHAAYPLLSLLYLRGRWPWAAWLMAAWGVLVFFAIVYLGHHYVIDIIGGLLYALAGYLVVERSALRRLAGWSLGEGERAVRRGRDVWSVVA